jgi:hypothetical protein
MSTEKQATILWLASLLSAATLLGSHLSTTDIYIFQIHLSISFISINI